MRHLNTDAILWCGKHFFLKRVLIRLTTKSGCNYIWQPAKTIHHFLFFSQTKVGKMLKQYCTTSENHLKFCSNTLTQEAFKNLYYTFYNVGRPFYVVATFSTNFERTVVIKKTLKPFTRDFGLAQGSGCSLIWQFQRPCTILAPS